MNSSVPMAGGAFGWYGRRRPRLRRRRMFTLLFAAIVAYVVLGRGLQSSNNTPKAQAPWEHSCPCEGGLRHKEAATTTVAAGGFGIEGSLVWGGSVIRGTDGNYHIFASRWDEVLSHRAWVVSSEIVHGVSSSPLGPFRLRDVALPRRGPKYWDGMATHNPTIHWDAANKQYALFYIGMTYNFAPPVATEFFNRSEYEIAWNSKRIGVAVSPSLGGPWRRLDAPVLTPRRDKWDAGITSNPSAHLFGNGTVLLLYKSIAYTYPQRLLHPEVGFHIGAARAASVVGPYERIGDGPILTWSAGGKKDKPLVAEDPFVWVCEATMRIHLIFKAMAYIFRDDGTAIRTGQLAYTHTWSTPWSWTRTWKWAQPTRIFNDTFTPADGSTFTLFANEEHDEAASERDAWTRVEARTRNARTKCRASKRAANLRSLLKKKKDSAVIRDATAVDEARDSVEQARDYEEEEHRAVRGSPTTSTITMERLERPQLLFSVDGKNEPTHAYLAAFHNGFSMNLAVPLGSSPSARRMPHPGVWRSLQEWLHRTWFLDKSVLTHSALATRNWRNST